jgi:DNA-3-methyladenine glycosylase
MAKRSMKLLVPNSPKAKLSLQPIPTSFYRRSATIVAQELLGKILVRDVGKQRLLARIVETEAYLGGEDPASHAYRGMTERTRPMFEPGGIFYVYISYGMHRCLNVVTGAHGGGEAVLIRAAEPLEGMDLMQRHRGRSNPNATPKTAPYRHLLSGPGKLCQALKIGLEFNFHHCELAPLRLLQAAKEPLPAFTRGPRIGISKGQDAPLRFCTEDTRYLSRRLAPSSV